MKRSASLLLMIAYCILGSFPFLYAQGAERLIFCVSDDWAPYSSASDPNDGLLIIIGKAAFKAVGRDVDFAFMPWARAIQSAKSNQYAGVIGAWYTDERAKEFVYSTPIIRNDIVFFHKRDTPVTFSSLEGLKPYTIGAVRGSGYVEKLRAAGLAENIYLTSSYEISLRMLIENRYDLFIEEKYSVMHLINTKYPEWVGLIEAVAPPVESNGLYVIVPKANPRASAIINDFNVGLRKIQESGVLKKLLKEKGFGD